MPTGVPVRLCPAGVVTVTVGAAAALFLRSNMVSILSCVVDGFFFGDAAFFFLTGFFFCLPSHGSVFVNEFLYYFSGVKFFKLILKLVFVNTNK